MARFIRAKTKLKPLPAKNKKATDTASVAW